MNLEIPTSWCWIWLVGSLVRTQIVRGPQQETFCALILSSIKKNATTLAVSKNTSLNLWWHSKQTRSKVPIACRFCQPRSRLQSWMQPLWWQMHPRPQRGCRIQSRRTLKNPKKPWRHSSFKESLQLCTRLRAQNCGRRNPAGTKMSYIKPKEHKGQWDHPVGSSTTSRI